MNDEHPRFPEEFCETVSETTSLAVFRVLRRAREVGYLGPGQLAPHLAHACAFVTARAAVAEEPPIFGVDLGSGAGLPGLILAVLWPTSRWILIDSSERRCSTLRDSVEELDVSDRVEVLRGRAEEVGRLHAFRAQADLVVARGFASPPITAECAAPFLSVDGLLVVSDPPESSGARWDVAGLAKLQMRLAHTTNSPFSFSVIRQDALCAALYARPVGTPKKRPIW